MFRWGRGNSRGCCIVVPVGCLLSGTTVLLLSGMAVAKMLASGPPETEDVT
jgi:hypothetical protein